DYRLQGVDLTWQAGRGTVVKLEHSRSESTGTPVFVSDNGGFDFVQTNAGIGHREGEASALELQANFKEIGWTERNASLRAWSRQVDAGYSVARNDSGLATREHGAQLRGELSDTVALYALVSRVERGAESLQQLQLTGQWRASEDDTLSAEVRRVTEDRKSTRLNSSHVKISYAVFC